MKNNGEDVFDGKYEQVFQIASIMAAYRTHTFNAPRLIFVQFFESRAICFGGRSYRGGMTLILIFPNLRLVFVDDTNFSRDEYSESRCSIHEI